MTATVKDAKTDNPTTTNVSCECHDASGTAEVIVYDKRRMKTALTYDLRGSVYIGRSRLLYCANCHQPVLTRG